MLRPWKPIAFKREYRQFPASASWVTISNPDKHPSSGIGVNPGIRSRKKALIQLSFMSKSHRTIGSIYFTKRWRAKTLTSILEFDNFKPRLKSSILKYISGLNGSFLRGDDRRYLKEGVKTFLMAPMSPLDYPTFLSVFSSTHNTSIVNVKTCGWSRRSIWTEQFEVTIQASKNLY